MQTVPSSKKGGLLLPSNVANKIAMSEAGDALLFHVRGGWGVPDKEGTVLLNLDEAQQEAVKRT